MADYKFIVESKIIPDKPDSSEDNYQRAVKDAGDDMIIKNLYTLEGIINLRLKLEESGSVTFDSGNKTYTYKIVEDKETKNG